MTKIANVNTYKEVRPILKDINWNFYQTLFDQDRGMVPFDTRKYIAYPATYVPEIPFTLIEILTKPGAVILDPFSGSGTTFFQALIQNRVPYGSDICLVSIKYIHSLFLLFDRGLDLNSYVRKVQKIISNYNEQVDYSTELQKKNDFIEDLRGWYSEKTFNMICFIIREQIRFTDEHLKAIMTIALFNVIKNTCCQDRGWGCIADNMIPKKSQIQDKDVFRVFLQKINLLISDVKNRLVLLDSNFDKTYQKLLSKNLVFNGDIRKWEELKPDSIDCIVTSPPYPNMADYITSQRLNYYYLNSNPDKEKFNETGARFKRARANSIDMYFHDMLEINEKLSKLLRTNGYLCLVLPEFDNLHQRDAIRKDVIQKIVDNLGDHGLIKKDIFERVLPSMRRAHNQKWASLKKEKIYIYQKI